MARTINGYALTFYDALPVRRVPTDNVGIAIRYQFSRGSREACSSPPTRNTTASRS